MKGLRLLVLSELTLACGGEPPSSSALAEGSGTGRQVYVVDSVPALGEENVYPAPIGSGMGAEAKLSVWFSEAIETTTALRLEGGGMSFEPAVEWDDSRTELSAVIRPGFGRLSPLADHTEYTLDLSRLRAVSGAALDPNQGLSGGKLVFWTGAYDALLNHSCGHTLFGPFQDLAASSEPESGPDIGTTHIQYSVLLPGAGAEFSGWLRAHFANAGRYRLYFDAETRVELARGADGAGTPVALTPTPGACPGITHEATLDVLSDETVFMRIGPEKEAVRNVIVELVTE